MLELLAYRITGHSRRDPALYQPKEERQRAKENEPIIRFKKYLLDNKIVEESVLDRIDTQTEDDIEEAVEQAQKAPEPKPEDTLEDMFVESV